MQAPARGGGAMGKPRWFAVWERTRKGIHCRSLCRPSPAGCSGKPSYGWTRSGGNSCCCGEERSTVNGSRCRVLWSLLSTVDGKGRDRLCVDNFCLKFSFIWMCAHRPCLCSKSLPRASSACEKALSFGEKGASRPARAMRTWPGSPALSSGGRGCAGLPVIPGRKFRPVMNSGVTAQQFRPA
jgi:hypothetical protein